MNRFQEWCRKERVDRPEKDTSQDMCPTNGDALVFKFIMLAVGTLLALAIYFRGI